jgi:hypothetical protein
MPFIVEGTIPDFRRYFGTAYFANFVNGKTSGAKSRLLGWCEGVGRERHQVDDYSKLQFCHPPGRGRLDILDEVLARHKISDTTIRCDIETVIKEFWEAHLPIIADGSCKYLCADCHGRYR